MRGVALPRLQSDASSPDVHTPICGELRETAIVKLCGSPVIRIIRAVPEATL